MLRMFRNDSEGSDRSQWQDGEPVPKWLDSAMSVVFEADGRELELIRHAMNGDTEYIVGPPGSDPLPEPVPGRPRLVQLVRGQGSAMYALDEQGQAWHLEWQSLTGPKPMVGRYLWRKLAEFKP